MTSDVIKWLVALGHAPLDGKIAPSENAVSLAEVDIGFAFPADFKLYAEQFPTRSAPKGSVFAKLRSAEGVTEAYEWLFIYGLCDEKYMNLVNLNLNFNEFLSDGFIIFSSNSFGDYYYLSMRECREFGAVYYRDKNSKDQTMQIIFRSFSDFILNTESDD